MFLPACDTSHCTFHSQRTSSESQERTSLFFMRIRRKKKFNTYISSSLARKRERTRHSYYTFCGTKEINAISGFYERETSSTWPLPLLLRKNNEKLSQIFSGLCALALTLFFSLLFLSFLATQSRRGLRVCMRTYVHRGKERERER